MTSLDHRVADLRGRLSRTPTQLAEIHALYAEFVRAGRPFPPDLEEHSLRLILEFVRPDDIEAARRLVTVLTSQGKPVPDDLRTRVQGPTAHSPALALDAVLAQIEAGVAERQTVMTALADVTARGETPPLLLEMAVLQHFLAEDPSRTDLKRRLVAVLRLLGRTVPAPLAQEVRDGYLREEYAIDFQKMLDEFAARVRFSDMEPEFFPLLEEVRRYTMTSVERLYALWSAVRYLTEAEVPGDFVEAGVWRGGSVMLMARELMRLGRATRRLWLYDTFAGLPRPDAEIDIDVLGNRAIDGWRMHNVEGEGSIWAYADEAEVRANMAATGYPSHLLEFVVGKVEDTIPKVVPDRIALLRIDTDWYQSYRHLLGSLYDRLVPGGILILDDYGHMLGARRATDEFRQERRIRQPLLRVDYSCRMMIKP